MKDLYIIGAGGFGREVAWLVNRINRIEPTWEIKGFIDDNESLWGIYEGGYKVLGGCEYLKAQAGAYAVCAIGTSKTRKAIIEKLKGGSVKFATVVDPSVIIAERAEIGEGTIICAGTIVAIDCKIARHVIINLSCTIGHDDCLEDYVTVNPGVNVSGNVLIGHCSELGTGMQIIQGKRVVPYTIIGAGAVVVKDISESGTYVGNPVRKIK